MVLDYPVLSPAARPGRPWVIAHRGDSSHAPENTLEAAREGHRAGADAWELDVQLTSDGVPIVLHDDSLKRTTDVDRVFEGDPRSASGFLAADFDLDEIRSLDAGSWFVDSARPRSAADFGTRPDPENNFRSGRVRIPKLEEALQLTVELDWWVNVELKSLPRRDPRLLDRVLEAIESTGTVSRRLLADLHQTGDQR